MISFVTFYIKVPPQVTVPFMPATAQVEDPVYFINTMFDSAALFHPECEKVLLTDLETQFTGLSAAIQLIRIPNLKPKDTVLAKLQAQTAYLETTLARYIVLLDYDILINSCLETLFEQPFDVAITYRLNFIQLFNTGIIFVKQDERRRGALFFQEVTQNLIKHHPRYFGWEGDQIALLTYINPFRFFVRLSDFMEVKGFSLLFLHCSLYNYTPAMAPILAPLNDKKVIHFKGGRKLLLKDYWEQFLKPVGDS